MPGKGYLNKSRRSRPAEDMTHRTLVNQGLRQEWREGVSNTAPVDTGRALGAATRAYAAGPAAYAQPRAASAGTAGDGEVLS